MEHDSQEGGEPGKSHVDIVVNGHEYSVRRGRHTVAEIKAIDQIQPTDELEQVVDGRLKPLPDDGFVIIHGDEKFVSHPRSGSSA